MNRFSFGLTLSALFAATVGFSAPAQSQIMAQTPFTQNLSVSGVTGGSQASSCGYIASSPSQTIQVTEAFTSLDITVQSTGDYTLLITGPNGFSECVMAHDFDGGVIQSPGLLNQGTYNIYVGDRSGAQNPFTLLITQ
jgi:hypothetical protein